MQTVGNGRCFAEIVGIFSKLSEQTDGSDISLKYVSNLSDT